MIKPSPLDLAHRRPVAPISWPEFKAEITPDFSVPKVSKGYAKRFQCVCRLLEGIGVETTDDLHLGMVDAVVAGRPPGQSAFTLQGLLVSIRTICSKAVRLRYLDVSPFAIKPVSKWVQCGKPKGKHHLTRDEIARLLEVLRSDVEARKGWGQWKARRLLAIVCIGLYCGLRKMELLRLHVADLDLPARLIRLAPHNETGKFKTASSADSVPMPEALIPIIQEWLCHRLDAPKGFAVPDGCPWLIPTCDREKPWCGGHAHSRPIHQLQAAAKRAGIDHITLHMLRKSCATHLEASGVPRSLVSRILRHSGEKVTEHFYLQRDEQTMVDAVKDVQF